ncbi:MAG: FAD-dependent oxidoreductase [Alphaproteobacteria bacterium]|jgi:glycine/D-amino acid oxidase-like deaminating enzyme|nr:FAD-dependent oxidoreductase [Alphaproteobacteria bacterium]
MRILIVGAGIYGLCAAWALRRAGHDVVMFEQHTVGNPLGSSGDQHRLIRYAYGETPGYMRMVGDGYAAWDRMWRDLGVKLQIETGTLALGQAGTNWCAQSQALLEGDRHEVETLDRKTLAARFPLIDPQGVEQAFYLKTGGALLADRITTTLARFLREQGVAIHEHMRVAAIDADAGRLHLEDGTVHAADLTLVCAGPWVSRLVPELGSSVTPSRQVVIYLEPPPEQRAAWVAHPMLLDIGDGAGFYMVPPVAAPDLQGRSGGWTGLKIGDHSFSLTGDPDRDRQPALAEAAPILEQCAKRLRGFDRFHVAELKTCFYTVEPREHFIARQLGQAGWALSCCSGHGFKFASAIGEGFASLLAGGITAEHFSRWVGGQSVHSPVAR